MLMANKTIIAGMVLCFLIPIGYSRQKRPNQIPNGSKFTCLNCHYGQGGIRNPFGSIVESGYLTVPGMNGDVVWGNALAILDADGDGFANGVELQDSAGTWRSGNPAPGAASWVTNPGDAKSKPVTAVDDRNVVPAPRGLEIGPNYPNPFNPSTRIRIAVPCRDRVRITILDAAGVAVWSSTRIMDSSGETEVTWDGNDSNRNPVASGVYVAAVQTSKESKSIRMLLIR
jgi:hypothetical protein